MNEQQAYKVVVKKPLLYEFLLCQTEEINDLHIKEVYKVLDIVMYKHFSSRMDRAEDLKHSAFAIILERRERYNPEQDAYNYIYSQARNEIGNNIYRWTKESRADDMEPFRCECGAEEFPEELDSIPPACLKYMRYLTGEADFEIKRISQKDVTDIIVWLRYHEKKTCVCPEFLRGKNGTGVLYKLIKDLIEK